MPAAAPSSGSKKRSGAAREQAAAGFRPSSTSSTVKSNDGVRHHHSSGRHGLFASQRQLRRWLQRSLLCLATLILLQWFASGSNLLHEGVSWAPKRVLVLTAHPDDEVMFFAPAILVLKRLGAQVHGLCISTGNAEGLGATRLRELELSYEQLGVATDRVTGIDDVALQDGMRSIWDDKLIAEYVVKQSHATGPYDAILTFDQVGITRHLNHIACNDAARRMVQSQILRGTRIYALRSLPVYAKFLGLPVAIVHHVAARIRSHLALVTFAAGPKTTWLPDESDLGDESIRHPPKPEKVGSSVPDTMAFLSTPGEYIRSLYAMSQHRSQLVWFRYLYVVFSGFMYGVQLDLVTA